MKSEEGPLAASMLRLLVHVEGQTEENFVNEVLQEYLLARGFDSVAARMVGNPRLRRNRGGIRSWPMVRKEIIAHPKSDASCYATTMVDYYALPTGGLNGWPGRDTAAGSATNRAEHVEDALGSDLGREMGDRFRPERFVPFVIMHEYEAWLFSDCDAFSSGIGQPSLGNKLQGIRDQFESPEEIDDSPVSAPSKRITALLPGYQKPVHGVLGILEIGLDRIRAECAHFDDWLSRLEKLARQE